jgi:hypothetical protein
MPFGQRAERHWARIMVALNEARADGAGLREHRRSFHAFDDGIEMQLVRHIDGRAQDCLAAALEVAMKAPSILTTFTGSWFK